MLHPGRADLQQVVLVDRSDIEVGVEERATAHLEGLLHRAVSVFLFDPAGRVLLQKRSRDKSVFGGKWANSCCTHPRPGEDVAAAAERRVREELGIDVPLVRVGSFIYEATDDESGQKEHEFDHVLVGVTSLTPDPDPVEIEEIRWLDLGVLRETADDPMFAPWLGHALRAFPDLGAGLGDDGRPHRQD